MQSLRVLLTFCLLQVCIICAEISSSEIDAVRRSPTNTVDLNQTTTPTPDVVAADREAVASMVATDFLTDSNNARGAASDHQHVPLASSSTLQSQQHVIVSQDHGQNFTNLIRIADILDVFNVNRIGKMWTVLSDQLSGNCSVDMLDYLQGLQNGRLWAIKMDDASGHYTTGFFYGNNYFTGSLSLCTSIYKDNLNKSTGKNDANRQRGLSSNGYYVDQEGAHQKENPSFLPGFFVTRLSINDTSILQGVRTIHVGLCLPESCTTQEVQKMIQFSEKEMPNRIISILSVRSPTQQRFDFWSDRTFVILVVVSSIVTFFLIWGTTYEILINYQMKQKLQKNDSNDSSTTDSSSGIGCTTYDLTDALPNKKDLPVGIVIPRGMNNNNSDENLTIDTVSSDTGVKLNIFSELLLSFSILTNFKAICDRTVGSDTIPTIHGLRAISMAWVILGHTCIVVFKYSDNMELRKEIEQEFLFQTITNGAYSVDTFFFISGFLVSYIYFRTNAKGNLEKLSKGVNEITAGTFHFFGLIGYRFVRLTAPYMFVLGVVEVTMKYFEHNSVFDPPTLDHVNCPEYWWRNVLYINTLFPVEDMCMLWSWYLADDTQFYIIGAIILIIAVRHFKMAASILLVFMMSSWATTAYVAFSYNHVPNADDPLALFDKIYDKPWTRLGPYLIGMSVGWFLFKTNCKIRMKKPTVVAGWVSSGCGLLYLIYGLYQTELTQVGAAAYSSLSHSAWALCLAWVVIACSAGYGGYINSLLSTPFIYPFSRVTYCAYLVHPIVIRMLALNSDSPLHLGTDSMAITFFGQVVTSYILSFIVSLSFEAPVVTMLKILTPNRKKRVL